jgi:hypothetical protein
LGRRLRHFDLGGRLFYDARLAAQIEFENTGNHDDALGPMPVLEHREPECFRARVTCGAVVVVSTTAPVKATVIVPGAKL